MSVITRSCGGFGVVVRYAKLYAIYSEIYKRSRMFLVLALLFSFSPVMAQDLDDYIQRFKLEALKAPPRRQALFQLGSRLFFDTALSGKGNISCNSCHSNEGFSGDALPLGVGEGAVGLGYRRVQHEGLVLARHTPPVYNQGLNDVRTLFWDGRVMRIRNFWMTPEPKLSGENPELKEVAQTFDSILSVQAIFPIASPEEMLGKESKLTRFQAWDQAMSRLGTSPEYQKLFARAFPGVTRYNIAHVGNALAEFQRHHFLSINTPWDLYLRGNKVALNDRMKKGAVLFLGKAQCFQCHIGDQLTSFGFQNIGVPQLLADDQGRKLITQNPNDIYKFRVSPLRNVGVTAPYMHSGTFQTLWEVIEHYNDPHGTFRQFQWNPRHRNYRDPLNLDHNSANHDNRERTLSNSLARNLYLTNEEKADLFCFLKVALTDMPLQKYLKGVDNEVAGCSPLIRK